MVSTASSAATTPTGWSTPDYCLPDRTIGWDRGELLPSLKRAHGDIGVVMVLAHEYGHAMARLAGLSGTSTPTLVGEQQADCLSGAYMRWVAEDNSPRFTLSTGEGLNQVLAGVISFRDPLLNEGDPDVGVNEHGSAFERVSAFQFGFTDGPSACAAIDLREISQRRGDLPVLLPEDQTGELPVTDNSVRSIIDAMGILFAPNDPPALSLDPADAEDCADARPSPPASFCPATNTIVVDVPGLADLGAQPYQPDGSRLAAGDNMAYSVLVSRYMLAIQQRTRRRAARQRRGRVAHGLPHRGGHRQDDEGSHHTRRPDGRAHSGRRRRGGVRHPHQWPGGQRRQRRVRSGGVLQDRRVPGRGSRRRGPLLQTFPMSVMPA